MNQYTVKFKDPHHPQTIFARDVLAKTERQAIRKARSKLNERLGIRKGDKPLEFVSAELVAAQVTFSV